MVAELFDILILVDNMRLNQQHMAHNPHSLHSRILNKLGQIVTSEAQI